MDSKPKIYLATPFGFSPTQRQYLLPIFVKNLHALGNLEVYEPFTENEKRGIRMSAAGSTDWAFQVAGANRDGMKACDAVFAVVNGVPPDEGVCTELGIAIALNKPVFLFRDDYRRSANTDTLPLNLMVFSGMSATTWEDHYYTTMADLKNPRKALAKWLKSHADPPERRVDRPRAGPDLGASQARRTSKIMLQENSPPRSTKAPVPPKAKEKRAAPVAAPVPGATQTPPPPPQQQPSAAQKAAKKVEQMGFPLDEVFKIFTQFDTDGSGIISTEELEAMFVKLCNGKKVSKEFVDERRAEADLSGDGQIDFEEYVEFTTGEKIPGVEDLRKGFMSFPREKDGTIKVASFIDSVKSKFDSGVKLDRIIKEVDRNSDGKLSFSEYIKVQAMPDLRNKPVSYAPLLKAPQTPHCFHKNPSPRANSPSPRPTTRTVRESPLQDQKTGRRLSKTLLQDDEPPPRRTTSRDVPRSSSGSVAPSAPAPQSRDRTQSEPVEGISFKLTRPSITPDNAAELDAKNTNLASSTQEKPEHKSVVRAVIHSDNIPYNINPERESIMGHGNRERPLGRSRSPYPRGQHRRGHSVMTRGAQANLMTSPPPAPVVDAPTAGHQRSQSTDHPKRESGTYEHWSEKVPCLQTDAKDRDRNTVQIAGSSTKQLSAEKEAAFRRMSNNFTVAHAAKSGNADIRAAAGKYRELDNHHKGHQAAVRRIKSDTSYDDWKKKKQRRDRVPRSGPKDPGRLASLATSASGAHAEEAMTAAALQRIKRETISQLLAQQQEVRSGYTYHRRGPSWGNNSVEFIAV